MIKKALEMERFSVECAFDGKETFRKAKSKKYDAILLDIMMPERTGFDVITSLRSMGNDTPILVISARTMVEDRVRAINLGADDFLVKSFSFPELVARIKSLVRRCAQKSSNVFHCGDLVVNLSDMTVKRQQKVVELSKKELDVLLTLIKNKDALVSREDLMRVVWGKERSEILSNTVEVHMQSLRRKLGNPSVIQTVHGRGYVLRIPEKE
jgi:DNA-binding response OmpR family regulator